jgi:hypothetical protein
VIPGQCGTRGLRTLAALLTTAAWGTRSIEVASLVDCWHTISHAPQLPPRAQPTHNRHLSCEPFVILVGEHFVLTSQR